ncbi:hypothetical protein [Streptacidiphilus cavernicola]|uniref:Uncharacterized protein n=1 Tax=Streptacidiphilus cavernicola TaxID=3342716 RepID=A0ABV6W2B2_9ACTN
MAERRPSIWQRANRPDRKCSLCKGPMLADADGWRVCETCDGGTWQRVNR